MRQLSSRTDQTGVLAAGDRVVVVRSGRRLLLSDPAGTLRATVPVPEARDGLAVGPEPDAIWVADPARGGLLRVDPGFEPLAPNSATESILSRITSILGPR